MTTSVFVSGATGFIAQHIVVDLLAKNYKVVGSVRSAAKGDALKKNLRSDNFSYEIVEDIQKEGAFDKALEAHPEVTVVLHTASPFTFNVEDPEKDLLLPALKGTENVLKSIKAHASQVKRVVVTSSFAAILSFNPPSDPDFKYTEQHWNPITWEESKKNSVTGYVGSKKIAEKAAWDFVKNEKPNFELSTVNPVYVFGPQAFDSEVKDELNTSAEIVNKVLKSKSGGEVADANGSFIDVRDVAQAHLFAFESDKAVNQRLLLSAAPISGQLITDVVADNFPQLKSKIALGQHGENYPEKNVIDNHVTRELLGFEFKDLKTTIVDSVSQLVKSSKL